ncbi:MAG: hypothetical protein HOP19_00060 [Acidobacteria bacterium]|nr:hypothetical protein [Acidobacteriota bacterium]
MDTTMAMKMTAQEEATLSELLAECLTAMQQARQQIEQDHRETDASKQRTWAMLNDMQRRFHVEAIS